jgi:peptidylprolyl isomerase
MLRLRLGSLGVFGVAVLALAGCNSSPSGSPASSTTPSTAAPTTVATVPVQDPSPAGTFGTAPTINVPPGAPPTQLAGSDLIVGTGPVVKMGDKVTAQYVLATYSTGQQIQTSWTSSPFSFVLAKGKIIDGWVGGVPGMRVGGRRELIIPPSLGYGSTSPTQGIAPNDTLVFIVDVVKVG